MVDILAISPHPDDAEIGCGGLLLLSKKKGHSTGIIYLTRGEMGTGGTEEIRIDEMKEASKLLELDYMDIVGFKDCQVKDTYENRLILAKYIRQLKPKIIILPYWSGTPGRGIGHTDHLEAGMMASHAVNFARLKKMPISEPPHNVKQVLYYLFPRELKPTFIVDITEVAPQWIKALKSHHSQMFGPHAKKTGFFKMILAWTKYMAYGTPAKYAQGFISAEPLYIQDPFILIDPE